jgi:hypothetical protein
MPAPDLSRSVAELSVVADAIDRYCDRVGAIAEPYLGSERDDVATIVHEAERQLRIAARTLHRAVRSISA